MSLWNALPYHTKRELKGGLSVCFKDAGHILGSAIIEITYNEKNSFHRRLRQFSFSAFERHGRNHGRGLLDNGEAFMETGITKQEEKEKINLRIL